MIGIVGGGIGGLALGLALREREREVVVLEREARAGGVIRSTRVEGRVLDHGPQRTRLSPEIASLIRSVGLEPRTRRVPEGLPLYVFRRGRLRPVPFGVLELLRSDLLSSSGRARLLAEPLTAGLREDETAGTFFRRKLGKEAYEAFVGPLFAGLYGSDPEEMYARHALREILEALRVRRSLLVRYLRGAVRRAGAIPAVTFEDGMEELPRELARALGPALRLSTLATAVEPRGGGWRVRTEEADWDVETVVLTTPAPVTAALVGGWAPELATRLRTLRYNELVLVHLLASCDLEGWGYQVAFGEGVRTRGVTWNASALGRDGLHTAFLGGAKDREAPELDDAEIAEIARREFRKVTGCEARPISVGRTLVPSWDRSWKALDDFPSLPGGIHLLANWESRVGIPARIRKARTLAERLAESASRGRNPGARV